ncbi:hypothetical protein QTP86_025229, partial [Hemibagrus guttatus]
MYVEMLWWRRWRCSGGDVVEMCGGDVVEMLWRCSGGDCLEMYGDVVVEKCGDVMVEMYSVSPSTKSCRVFFLSLAGVPMLSVQPKGKQKGCAGCNRKIKDRYLLKALDKYWHEDCLKCACCDCRLGEVGSTLYTKANLILCRRDYLSLSVYCPSLSVYCLSLSVYCLSVYCPSLSVYCPVECLWVLVFTVRSLSLLPESECLLPESECLLSECLLSESECLLSESECLLSECLLSKSECLLSESECLLSECLLSESECLLPESECLLSVSECLLPKCLLSKSECLLPESECLLSESECLLRKGRELADVMERRKVDILCVQETRWKGSKAHSIGAGFKLFYYGVDSKRNGVGVVLKEEFVRNVLEVKRVSDRVMSLKLEIEGVMLNVVSGYAPQVGCELEEKERFWSELDEVMESIPTGERVVIGADFNGHVGEGNRGDEEVMGKFGVKERNLEGQMVVDFAKRMDMAVVNTYFQKREEHRVTYKSGGRRTQKKRSKIEIEKKTKWWKLIKEECCEEFRQKLRQALGGQVVLPDDWETTAEVIRETGRKVLGVSSGRRKEDKETWWWNEEVQDSIQRKRLAKKKWDMERTEENRQEYKELQRRVKREVSKAKQKAYDELYTRLDTREGEKDLYRLARQRDRDGKDVQQVRVIKDRDGRVLTSEESVQRRWKEYFEELMNEENEREKRVEGVNSVEQKVDKIRKDEVRKALKRMKSGKAVGPDDIPVEVWKCLGEAAVEFLASLFNRVLESERMPEEWRRSVLVPIFKNKGDVQSCSNYRGIKLMSHTMKLWERVVEARLRKIVEICEQQYGFMPRKSTTDAIFALRILMEKYRDGQRELHYVFVDLEKAYDRVPREELWYCMRKSGVAEKYVRVVQDMYERSRTVVRCAIGQTEEFKVEVGLHRGSALSPFLFAIVMDQLSEEVRQESPWTVMFADDIVICSESREQVEENLERWRFALERRGMKVSGSKTEYMCVNEREGSGTVRLQGEEVKKVQEFKYLGSTVQSNGECGKDVKKRVQAGWNGWRKVWGVLCDRKISARIKGKVYRTVVRAAMLYGLEAVSLRKRQESELEVAELKMLRFSLGVTRLNRIRDEYIRGTAHVGRLGDKVRETRLRWFGHVQRRESEYIGRRMLDMELPGRRQRGRPKRRLFGTTGNCAACSKLIPAFEMVMRARDNVYHLDCFACQLCNQRFCVGDKFFLKNNMILCQMDYEEGQLNGSFETQ